MTTMDVKVKLPEDPPAGIVVFGAGGLLGRAIVREAARTLPPEAIVAFDRKACDVTSGEAIKLGLWERVPASSRYVVINCAAKTHVDACEREGYAEALDVNGKGPSKIYAAMATKGLGHFIHISTNAVFDGTEPGYHDRLHFGFDEFAQPCPLSAYARTKWAGEEELRRIDAGGHWGVPVRHTVLRVGHLYGPGGKGRLSGFRDALLHGKDHGLNIEHDRLLKPTYVRDVASFILRVVHQGNDTGNLPGTLHAAPSGPNCTEADFGCSVAKEMGLAPVYRPLMLLYRGFLGKGDPDGDERVMDRDLPHRTGLAWRPKFGSLRSSYIAPDAFGTVEEGIARYVADMKEEEASG